MDIYPVVIIGAGPAGLAAAMQLTRQGHSPLILERSHIGGLLRNANLVENYPGFPGGIRGPKLVSRIEEQAQRLDVNIFFEEALVTDFEDGLFRIETCERSLSARFLIAATGTQAIKLPEDQLGPGLEDKVFSEVYPLVECSGKKIVIIGGGDAAFDYALNLAGENQVRILIRGEEFKALPLLIKRAQAHPDVTIQSGIEVDIIELDQDGKLHLSLNNPDGQTRLTSDFLIAAIGREPDTSFASPSIIKQMDRLQEERQLYLIGDLKNGAFRQTAIAVGDGLMAAMEIDQLLSKESL
jgi:thioredoxin reductase